MAAMAWFITGTVGEFLAAAGEFLRADPVRNSVVLTVTEGLRLSPPPPAPSPSPDREEPWFGWWRPPGGPGGRDPQGLQDLQGPVGAVFLHTPGFPVFVSHTTRRAAAELARDLAAAGRRISGVSAGRQAADAFAAAWQARTGQTAVVHRRMRLFRLGELAWPRPDLETPEGTARLAVPPEAGLLAGWFEAFAREAGDPPRQDHRAAVGERLGYGGITLWEAGGVPVSVAALTRTVAGMVRVGPVYTPPALRGRGYAGAATAAASQAALDAGVREVVLYTDLANPTSNALYQRLGYRPVEDRVILSFEPGPHGLGFTGERT